MFNSANALQSIDPSTRSMLRPLGSGGRLIPSDGVKPKHFIMLNQGVPADVIKSRFPEEYRTIYNQFEIRERNRSNSPQNRRRILDIINNLEGNDRQRLMAAFRRGGPAGFYDEQLQMTRDARQAEEDARLAELEGARLAQENFETMARNEQVAKDTEFLNQIKNQSAVESFLRTNKIRPNTLKARKVREAFSRLGQA
jgi:hypothetical protein